MKEHGTLFNRDMVLALLAGIKTNTRRALKVQPPANTAQFCTYHHPDPRPHHWAMDGGSLLDFAVACPYGQPGDRIYVKETFYAWGRWETRFSQKKKRDEWHFVDLTLESDHQYRYVADDHAPPFPLERQRAGAFSLWWKRPAIFMPRVAARILLEVTSVRVERLQDISEADAADEGWAKQPERSLDPDVHRDAARDWYADLWDQINGAGAWASNPWVWAVSFKVSP